MGVPGEQKDRVINSLKADIHANNDHLDTGIFGTQFFFEVLSENGMHELACKIMNQRTQPGYGWWIDQGATTSWEEWNGDGSHNHPMFGGGIVWFYRKLAGMITDPEVPGYKHIIFRPQPAEDITFASYSNLTPYGTAAISWKGDISELLLDVLVPVGSSATVYIPALSENNVTESGSKIKHSSAISFSHMEEEYAVYDIGSGYYRFKSVLK